PKAAVNSRTVKPTCSASVARLMSAASSSSRYCSSRARSVASSLAPPGSPGRVSTVGEDRLTGDPVPFVGEKRHQRGDVLDAGQPVAQTLRLVERHPLGCLLTVEERSVHRP